jgi:hypothetical protein
MNDKIKPHHLNERPYSTCGNLPPTRLFSTVRAVACNTRCASALLFWAGRTSRS